MNLSRAKIIIVACLVLLLAAAGWSWRVDSRSQATAEYAVLLQKAIAQFEQDNYAGTLKTLQAVPMDEVEDWQIPYYIGSSHLMLKDYPQAAQALDRALALDSQQTGILYALGVTHYKQGNLSLAKAYFSAVLEITPNDEHAKGLMDIMANLERQQSGQAEEQNGVENDAGKTSH